MKITQCEFYKKYCNAAYLKRSNMTSQNKTSRLRRRLFLATAAAGVCQMNRPAYAIPAGPINAARTPESRPSVSASGLPLPARLENLQRAAKKLDRLRALVVMHEGEVVFSEAFSGPAVDKAVNVKSVSKSINAALMGCALKRGVVSDVSLTLNECIPDLIPADADPRVRSITLGNLLSMQAGLQRTSGPFYGSWVASPNWVDYVLTRPFVAEPGGRMLYSTGDWHVLGAVLSRLSGASLLEITREWLGKPLDIDFAPWTKDPQGLYMGGNEMSLSPLHMARIGELYRLNGQWDDQAVLDDGWVEQSFTARGFSPYSGDDYGYGWFLRNLGNSGFAYARGYGGQFIHVLPAEGIVVAMTSDWQRSARGGVYTEQLHRLVTDHLVG